MPSVHELEGWGARLAALLDELPTEGETEESIMAALHAAANEYEGAVEDKTHGIVRVLQVIEDRETRAKRDKARASWAIAFHRRQRERVRRLLRLLLLSYEETTQRRRVVTTYATVSLAERTQYTYPEEASAWPAELCTVETTRKPDREAARAAIDAGNAPEGFGSEIVQTLTVRGRKK